MSENLAINYIIRNMFYFDCEKMNEILRKPASSILLIIFEVI
jgi:hypothetical protein